MINEEQENDFWPSFLIYLDLAIKEKQENLPGAPNMMGTRASMAIERYYGEKTSFMHDLKSLFGLGSGAAYIIQDRMKQANFSRIRIVELRT